MQGKWLMKMYSANGQALSVMPDIASLTYLGKAYLPIINLYGDDKFQAVMPGTPANRYAATFEGRFEVQTAGTYTFCTNSDDGTDLKIDGELVVDNGGLHPTKKMCVPLASARLLRRNPAGGAPRSLLPGPL